MVLKPLGTEVQSHGTLYQPKLKNVNPYRSSKHKLKSGSHRVAHVGSARLIYIIQAFYNFRSIYYHFCQIYCILPGIGQGFVYKGGMGKKQRVLRQFSQDLTHFQLRKTALFGFCTGRIFCTYFQVRVMREGAGASTVVR